MIKFTKMHGLGNDYVYIDAINQKIEKEPQLARFISSRNFGIGSDGLILICKSEIADFKMKMYNQDGSQAEMCGNGIRCVGKFVYDKNLTDKKILKIETLAGIKTLELNVENKKVQTIKVDMGEPILKAKQIPVISNKEIAKEIEITAKDTKFSFTCVSMGNPHAIIVVKNVKEIDVKKYGEIIENNEIFPNKTNVEFIQIIDKNNIKMRVWERGSGETLACGTGACASVVSCVINELTNREINVELLGGILNINWKESDNHVYMTGSATTVFEGELLIEKI